MVTFTALICYKFIFIKPTSVPQTEKVITVVDREMGKKEKILHHVIDYIRYENKTLKGEEMRNISELVYDESRRYKLDYRLVLSLMKVESNFRQMLSRKKEQEGFSRSSHPLPDMSLRMRVSSGRVTRLLTNRKRISESGYTPSRDLLRTSKTSLWPFTLTTLALQSLKK